MASSVVQPWRPEASEIKLPDPVRNTKTYSKSDKGFKNVAVFPKGRLNMISTSTNQPGKIQKTIKVKSYVCNLEPTATTSSFFGNKIFKKLMALQPISLGPPADIFEPCSNRAPSSEAVQAVPSSNLSNDLEHIEVQRLDEPVVEHIQIFPAPTPEELRLPLPVPSVARPTTILPAILEDYQAQPHDYSQSYGLDPNFRCDLDEGNLSVATDFLTPRYDELYLTLDDVMNNLLNKSSDTLNEVRNLLMAPRTIETIFQINNLMTSQQQSACALQQILSTYSVRRSNGRADPMMNS